MAHFERTLRKVSSRNPWYNSSEYAPLDITFTILYSLTLTLLTPINPRPLPWTSTTPWT